MKIVKAQNANQLFGGIARLLLNEGETRVTRGFETREINDETCLILENPSQSVVTMPPRHPNLKIFEYLEAEFKWFRSGGLKAEQIHNYAKFWDEIANQDGTVNSNYGYHTFYQLTPDGRSQFDWCLERLRADINTRQAVINMNQPMHKFTGNKDYVCTIGQQFIVRDGKIDSVVWMRSNDFIWGLTYNIAWFTFVQHYLAQKLGLPVGKYTHIATTLHVYAKHYPMMKEIADYEISESDQKEAERIWQLWQDFIDGRSETFANKI